MTSTRRLTTFFAVLILSLCSPPTVVQAGKITLRVQTGEKSIPVSGYDSSGVTFISIQEYAAALSLPCATSPQRRKIELRLPDHRIKATAGNPFLVVTEIATSISSVYQMARAAIRIDSTYFAPVSEFVSLLERLAPMGVSVQAESGALKSAPPDEAAELEVTGLAVEARLNGYLLTIKMSKKPGTFDAFLNNGWLYVTINDAHADTVALNSFRSGDAIRRVLVFQSPTSVQLTFQVSPDIVQADPLLDPQTPNLLVSLPTRTKLRREELERQKAEEAQRKQEETQDRLQRARDRSRLDVIVIDPGHGGKDPGTIGVTGTQEKDVALGIALKLGALIRQSLKDVRVVYTRRDDSFVELYQRGKIANDAGGKLFISIHCNSTERKPSPANGFEIYILRPGKTESAIRIAEKENDAIRYEENYKDRYEELTEERFILVTMRQSAFVRYSEEFAARASEAMADRLKIQNSGVKQAGFLVLVGASMPNVLVETGYLSNRKEERILRSSEGQRAIAEALLEGIRLYKSEYERVIH